MLAAQSVHLAYMHIVESHIHFMLYEISKWYMCDNILDFRSL